MKKHNYVPIEFQKTKEIYITINRLSFEKSSLPAKDTREIIGIKNSVYLDIYAARNFWRAFYFIVVIAFGGLLSLLCILSNGLEAFFKHKEFWFITSSILLFPFLILILMLAYYYLIPPDLPIMRFNRQRRQVYVRYDKRNKADKRIKPKASTMMKMNFIFALIMKCTVTPKFHC